MDTAYLQPGSQRYHKAIVAGKGGAEIGEALNVVVMRVADKQGADNAPGIFRF